MPHNFSASRLRNVVTFFAQSTGQASVDEYGMQKQDGDIFVFDCRADVMEKTGAQIAEMGKEASNAIISIMTYYDDRISTSLVAMYNGSRYQVEHIQRDSMSKSMIVTCTSIGDN